jgi:hypothetical protein
VAVSPIVAPGRTDCRLQKDRRRSAILDAAHVLAASGGGWASAGRGAEGWAVPVELDAERGPTALRCAALMCESFARTHSSSRHCPLSGKPDIEPTLPNDRV